MNKAERERQERRRRMLAREQGQAPTVTPAQTQADAVPKKTPRAAPQPAAQADNTRRITPLIEGRRRRRYTLLVVLAVALALILAALTGVLSDSIALLGDTADSLVLYLNRAGAGWPVNTGISEPLQIEELSGGFVELDEEDVVVYSAYGAKVRSFQPGYARPALAVGGSRFVVYNRTGNELQVGSRTRTLYTQTFENSILLCAMSANGTLAVVTEADRYAAQLLVFNASFRQIYSWQMTRAQGTPIAVDFAPGSRKFAAGTLAAKDGQLACTVYFMNTSSDAEGPSYTATQGSMLLSLDWQSDNRVMAVFDTYIAVLDPRDGTETARYDYGGASLQSAAPGRKQTALLLNVRGGNSLVTLDADLTPLAQIPAHTATAVTAADTVVYLLCPDGVECYSYDGTQNWVRTDFSGTPLAVLDARELLVFTGTTVSVLEAP